MFDIKEMVDWSSVNRLDSLPFEALMKILNREFTKFAYMKIYPMNYHQRLKEMIIMSTLALRESLSERDHSVFYTHDTVA